jgi:hypothetical protein
MVDRVDRHDIGVLQLSQESRFSVASRRNLEHDVTICEDSLAGQVYASNGSFAKEFDDVKTEKRAADSGLIR